MGTSYLSLTKHCIHEPGQGSSKESTASCLHTSHVTEQYNYCGPSSNFNDDDYYSVAIANNFDDDDDNDEFGISQRV